MVCRKLEHAFEPHVQPSFFLDFWTLPNARLSRTLADDVEHNFFARCPPEKRPLHLRSAYGDSDAAKDNSLTSPVADTLTPEESRGTDGHVTDADKKHTEGGSGEEGDAVDDEGKKSTRTATASREKRGFFDTSLASSKKFGGKEGKKYDSSLLRALHRTFFWRWWTAGIMQLMGGTLSNCTLVPSLP